MKEVFRYLARLGQPKSLLLLVLLCSSARLALAFDPQFDARIDYPTGINGLSSPPQSICLTDYDVDGDMDIILASPYSVISGHNVSILRNIGNGSFQHYPIGVSTVEGTAWDVVSADLNGDNWPDLIVTNSSYNNLSVFMNNGNGAFAVPVTYAVGSNPQSICAADMDSDGKPDLIAANFASNDVSVMMNNGNGTFSGVATYEVGTNPKSIAASDFNGDGFPDIVAANSGSNTVSILMNMGNGSFALSVDVLVGSGPNSISSADLNGDGYSDIAATTTGAVSILLNSGGGTFSNFDEFDAGNQHSPVSLVCSDFDGDGRADLAVTDGGLGDFYDISVLNNDGKGSFADLKSYFVGEAPRDIASADLNGDGFMDLVVAKSAFDGEVSVLLNDGMGSFPEPQIALNSGFSVQTPVDSVHVDVDLDGDIDLAVLAGQNVSVYSNNGSNVLTLLQSRYLGSSPVSLAAADVNGDNRTDLIVAMEFTKASIAVLTNRGITNGMFALPVFYGISSNFPRSVFVNDFDTSGTPDLGIVHQDSTTIELLINVGPFGPCCTGSRGNLDCDSSESVDIADLTVLVSGLFISLGFYCCEEEANCDGQFGVDIGDLTALVDHLFISFAPLAACE